MHTEADYAPIVAEYVRHHGIAEWDDIFRHVTSVITLDEDDLGGLDSDGLPRWQRIIRNLKSNSVLLDNYGDIIHVYKGFATIVYAQQHDIPEQTKESSGNSGNRRTGKRPPKHVAGFGPKYIRPAFKHHFGMLKDLYDRNTVLADINNNNMHTETFGIKYDIKPLHSA